ncbi:hypothetical protein FFF34_010315 [Inquilinus sp. KBS0705]|nr:hypothetical protein FFF34_010315 [Inquilinus sp. KBS0705]
MIDNITKAGRWIFPLSFLLYVGLHFAMADMGASFLPSWFLFPLFWNYFTGVCILLFIVSCLIGKYDKLAALLMAFYVLLTIFLIHIPRAADSKNDMLNIFRNIMVIGGLLLYANYAAKDKRIVN